MNIFALIFTILSIGTIGLSLTKPKYGALCYLIYIFLAPYLYIGGYIIYARASAILFLFFLIVKFPKFFKRGKLEPLIPYIVFLVWNLVFVIGSEHIGSSFSTWTNEVSSFIFILFLFANICEDIESVKIYKWALWGICAIFTLYGLFLTSMPGINPYRIITGPMFGLEFNEAYAAGNGGLTTNTVLAEGRLFGRISSLFDHPMKYGLNLGLFFIYSLYVLKNKPIFQISISGLIIIAIFTSGTRTPIGALGITILMILLYRYKFKYFVWSALGCIAIFYILPLISPEAEDYLMSIFNSDDSSTKGSSLSMRIEQLEGCFDIVKDDLLFGKGYGWTDWYNATYGGHPKALWFESLIYSILVNSGILGFFLWGWYMIKYYRYAILNIVDDQLRTYVLSLLLYFVVYCAITGDFHIKNMLIFYVVMLGMNMEIKPKSIE